MLFGSRRPVPRRRGAGKGIVICIFLLLLFVFFSPVRMGRKASEAWDSVWDRLIRISLYLELGTLPPDTGTDSTETPSGAYTPESSLPAAVDVIDKPVWTTSAPARGIYASSAATAAASVPQETEADLFADASAIVYRNETSHTPDTQALLDRACGFTLLPDTPQVLIVHTHTSESYTPDAEYPYTPDDNYRTLDTDFNVVAVGTHLAARLRDAGIGVIHDTTFHDYPSYSGSYSRSLATVESVLAQYPTIQVVIDLHRDAILDSSGIVHGTETTVETDLGSVSCAQLMLVVGSDKGGLAHPDWQNNLSFAARLQSALLKRYPQLMRPINLRKERFNQHTAPGAILLEVGSSGDTLGEALTAAELFADGLIAVLQSF